MGFKIGADIDLRVIVESMSRLEKKSDEINKRLREFLTTPHADAKDLYNNVQVPASSNGPLLIDLGAVPGGMQWDVKQVCVFANDPFTQTAGAGTVSQAQTGTGAASPIVLTFPAVANKLNEVSGFEITGLGATAGSTIAVTLAGVVGGTQTYDLTIPAGVTTAITPLVVTFNPPLPASSINTAITLTVPSFGAGNTSATASMEGLLQSGGGQVQASVFKGLPPSGATLITGQPVSAQDCIAPALSVPFIEQFGGKIAVLRGMQHLYVLVPFSSGLPFFSTIHATGSVVEVPDTRECTMWL